MSMNQDEIGNVADGDVPLLAGDDVAVSISNRGGDDAAASDPAASSVIA